MSESLKNTFRPWRAACVTAAALSFATMAFLACSSSSSVSPPAADGGKDVSVDGPKDSGPPVDAGVGLTCAKLLTCDQACSGSTCTNACYADSTAIAQGLFTAFDDCLDVECPSSDGGACASSGSSACSNCDMGAATGACVSLLAGCEGDTKVGPPNGDGGIVLPEAGADIYNCGELNVCLNHCPSGDDSCESACKVLATSKALSLYASLDACLIKACTDNGGPCKTPGTACNGCIVEADFSGACFNVYDACVRDTSNATDAGPPEALNDGGVLSTVLTGTNQAGGNIALGGGYIYYGQVNDVNKVGRVSLGIDGGTATNLGPVLPTPIGIAVDSNNVYAWSLGTFSGKSITNNKDGTVVQIPLAGGSPMTLASTVEVYYAAPYLNSIANYGTNLYWVNGGAGTDGEIVTTPIGSATPTALYNNQALPEAVITDGVNLYWANWGTFDASGNSNVDGAILQGPIGGGTVVTLAKDLPAPGSLAVDGTNVYWTNVGKLGGGSLPALDSGSVMQTPIGGGTVVTLASKLNVPTGISVDTTTVYWAVYGLGSPGMMQSTPIGGGTVTTLVNNLDFPYSLLITPTTMYWSYYSAAAPSKPSALIESLTPY
jgi:hypothetical protein